MTRNVAAPVDHRHSAILHRACRRSAPDIWLAVRFLPRDPRDQLLAAAAVLRLLSDVVAGREVERDPAAEDNEPKPPAALGCGCGSGSLAQRTAVAHNIVSFLFEEAEAATTGRPELEAFVAVRQARPLPRAAFDAFVDGCSAGVEVRRVATRRTRENLVGAVAGPLAEIMASIVLPNPVAGELCSMAAGATGAIMQARELLTLRRSLIAEDRCLVSLETLSRFSLRDSDLVRWIGSAETEPDSELDGRCTLLLAHLRRECLADLVDAAGLLELLPGGAGRAFAAVFGVWGAALCSEPLGRHEPPLALPDRLRAYRFRAWRHAIARRIDPRLAASAQALADPLAVELPMSQSDPVPHR